MNILITGASGMLGATIAKSFSNSYNVYGTGKSDFKLTGANYKKFDLLQQDYDELIEWSNPNIIIHCGALTNGSYCQQNPELAFMINGMSVKKLIDSTNKNVKIIYISTDAVFSSSTHMANEMDCVLPENNYGKSKELGEFFLNLTSDRDFTIIRTTIVGLNININKSSFVEWIINSSRNNEAIGLFGDVLFTPISTWDLIEEIKFLIISENINSEILHIAGEKTTKHEFGKLLLESLDISKSKLKETSLLSFKDRAKRATDQTLDSSFYKKKYNRNLPDLKSTINIIKKHYYEINQTRK